MSRRAHSAIAVSGAAILSYTALCGYAVGLESPFTVVVSGIITFTISLLSLTTQWSTRVTGTKHSDIRIGATSVGRRLVVAGAVVLVSAQALSLRLYPHTADALRARAAAWHDAQLQVKSSVLTSANAVRVVAFSDYECTFCAKYVPMYESVVSELRANGAPVEFVLVDFPLDPKCNRSIDIPVHPVACDVAVAVRFVRSARGDPTARELSQKVFRASQNLSMSKLQEWLVQLGLWEEYQKGQATHVAEVVADVELGRALGVHLTPTLFIDGRVTDERDRGALRAMLKYEVARVSRNATNAGVR
jgi:protein-disulfide isomerase